MAKVSTKKNKSWIWGPNQIIIFLLAINFILTIFISSTLYLFILLDIPDLNSISSYKPATTSFIYDNAGTIIDRIYRENRSIVPLSEMPDLLPKAFVAAEDARFFQHAGVDGWSILRALVHNLRAGGRGHGGSTITQQVARSLLLSPEKTYTRKIKEAILAYRIDKVLSKNDILYIYLNQIYLGDGAYGVEAASQTYFNKGVKHLTLSEMTILAGLPQAPSRYSPIKSFQLAKKRQAYVLNRMAEDGYISADDAREAYTNSLYLNKDQPKDYAADYFLEYIKQYVIKNYGNKKLLTGGLRIYTTLDSQIQNAATTATSFGVSAWAKRQNMNLSSVPQTALVALENQTGKILAMVGGNDFGQSQFNRATQAKRQPGSAFKPIIYAAALNEGFTPNELINDEETHFNGASGKESWIPKNFSGKFYGPTTLRNGLVFSRNIVTIKLLQEVGVARAINLAKKMGITSSLNKNLALALGSSELSLLELTAAYTVFASGGEYRPPAFIEKIIDRDGKVLEKYTNKPHIALDEQVAYQTTFLLQSVISEGTGKRARGIIGAAGKTGTTDQSIDAWFIGYTNRVTAGVWMGHDMYKSLGKHETGGTTAAPVWLEFMKEVNKKLPAGEFKVPEGITFIPVNKETGNFEYLDTDNALWEAFRKDNLRSWKDRLRR